jgi:hypothetical protein
MVLSQLFEFLGALTNERDLKIISSRASSSVTSSSVYAKGIPESHFV